jgi:hypothetical protein
LAVYATAVPATSRLAADAPWGPKRSPAQIRNGRHEGRQHYRLQPALARRLAQVADEEQHEGGDNQVAAHVAQPPHPEGRAYVVPGQLAAQAQARHADGRADQGADDRREHDERQHVAHPAQRAAELRPVQQVGAGQCLGACCRA